MATGDTNDFISRIRALLPPWFPNPTAAPPFITGLISAYATGAAFIYSLIAYAKLQTRIKTATDGWLDLISFDFFGLTFQRDGQTDTAFRQSIVSQIVRPRNTIAAIEQVLFDLTGIEPVVVTAGSGAMGGFYGYGYFGVSGFDTSTPYTVLVTAYRGNGASDAQITAAVLATIAAGITAIITIVNP